MTSKRDENGWASRLLAKSSPSADAEHLGRGRVGASSDIDLPGSGSAKRRDHCREAYMRTAGLA